MWSVNPQIHNPHWIYPGDMLFLRTGEAQAPQEPEVREIRLVMERLEPPPPPPPPAPEPAPAPVVEETTQTPEEVEAARAGRSPKAIEIIEKRAQDYIAPKKVDRFGSIQNIKSQKIASADNEEVEITLAEEGKVGAGDRLTAFDDRREVIHPVTQKSVGYQVRVVAHLQVLEVQGKRALAKVLRSYDTIEENFGVMPFRAPILSVARARGAAGTEGVVVAGGLNSLIFAADSVVFVDKGSADGIVPGLLLEVPYPAGPTSAQGIATGLNRPIARGVVVSAQEKTATVYLLVTRKAVEVGQRVVAAADSP
jgi:hypothetical protein